MYKSGRVASQHTLVDEDGVRIPEICSLCVLYVNNRRESPAPFAHAHIYSSNPAPEFHCLSVNVSMECRIYVNSLYLKLHWTGCASVVRYSKDLHYCNECTEAHYRALTESWGEKCTEIWVRKLHCNVSCQLRSIYCQRGYTQVNER